MPRFDFPPADWTPEGAITGLTLTPGVVTYLAAHLRRIGDDGTTFGFFGDLQAEATFTTPAVPMNSLSEVFGLQSTIRDRDSGAALDQENHLSVQVTLDGGVTYLTWSGVAWVVDVVGGVYTSRKDFDEYADSLPVPEQGASLGLRVKLSVGTANPEITSLTVFCEWDTGYLLDLFETVKLAAEAARFPVVRRVKLTAATNTITYLSKYTQDTSIAARVFNLTADPSRTTDLFSAWAGSDITLTAAQAGGDVLEYTFSGYAKVVVVQQDELVDVSELPITILYLTGMAVQDAEWTGFITEIKDGITKRLARTRQHFALREVDVAMEHHTGNPRQALSAGSDLLNQFEALRSRATGQAWRLDTDQPQNMRTNHSSGTFASRWTGTIRLPAHIPDYVEAPLVEQIDIIPVGPMFRLLDEKVTL